MGWSWCRSWKGGVEVDVTVEAKTKTCCFLFRRGVEIWETERERELIPVGHQGKHRKRVHGVNKSLEVRSPLTECASAISFHHDARSLPSRLSYTWRRLRVEVSCTTPIKCEISSDVKMPIQDEWRFAWKGKQQQRLFVCCLFDLLPSSSSPQINNYTPSPSPQSHHHHLSASHHLNAGSTRALSSCPSPPPPDDDMRTLAPLLVKPLLRSRELLDWRSFRSEVSASFASRFALIIIVVDDNDGDSGGDVQDF